ncbi:MAG: protein translocase subunit SecF [Rickettsiales bacterium]|nr:protein translocase subunit SecF [Rickettsiales bacterium]
MIIRIIKKTPNIEFLKIKKIFFILSIVLALLSLVFLFSKGLNYGIDFKGGVLVEVDFKKSISTDQLRELLEENFSADTSIQKLDGSDSNFLIKVELIEGLNQKNLVIDLKEKINKLFGEGLDYRRVEYVGPTVSKELLKAGAVAILVAIISMLIYIWFRFELPFAIGAVIALLHDTVLTVGMFSLTALEFNLSTVAAILLIIGYSMNDTVVVYDRVRENLKKFRKLNIQILLNKSINETLSRTINTTATTILALMALYIFGGNIIKDFSFAMIWGILIGTYSSILVATPLLLFLKLNRKEKNEE